ncbi:MAG: hypothetical protein VR69_05430 [Peptococcaceae bacterium BRH_c4b]|nr:MAG: hypothetical protein VR69_05430 [Peptococcaceae bacterium BRH_c4b]
MSEMDKSNQRSFQQDCNEIIKENADLDRLFSDTERILEYALENIFTKQQLAQQLGLIGGHSFSNVLIFCLDRTNIPDTVSLIKHAEIDDNLFNKIKFILAKYGPIYARIKQKTENPYGWTNTSFNIIQRDNDFLLEYIINLNNDNTLICRDTPDSMAILVASFIEGLHTVNKACKINSDLVTLLANKIMELSQEVQEGK